jgi:hypothetical protein
MYEFCLVTALFVILGIVLIEFFGGCFGSVFFFGMICFAYFVLY